MHRNAVHRLPLRGADLVLMAQHARWKRRHVSNNASLVVHCDGPLDPARLRAAIERFLDGCPWPAARLRRPFPWGKLHWRAGPRPDLTPPPVHHRVALTHADLQRGLEADLNATIDPRLDPPLRFTIIATGSPAAPAPGVLVATWFHPLMDPRGAQNLLVHLAELDARNGQPPGHETPPTFVASTARLPLSERGRLARRSLEHMRTLAPVPPVSLGAQLASPGPVRFHRVTFTERDPFAGLAWATREISWRLAVVGKAMTELWTRRGLPDVPFLLPISVDLRPKGEPGPMFGNMLAFHFARFQPSATTDVPALAAALRRQMADAVRDGQIEANAEAMEFLHYRPLSTMLRALPWTSSGESFSFHCADVADFPRGLSLLGRSVVNAYHVPCVLPRPGVGVFFNRCGGRHNVVVAWIDGAMAHDDAARIADVVGEGMGWIAAP
jgi:hypothetical protein